MKQSLKYGLFLVLALLIHVVPNETMEDNCRVAPRHIVRRNATYLRTTLFIMLLNAYIIFILPNLVI